MHLRTGGRPPSTSLERHPRRAGVITSPQMLPAALRRETGTWIEG